MPEAARIHNRLMPGLMNRVARPQESVKELMGQNTLQVRQKAAVVLSSMAVFVILLKVVRYHHLLHTCRRLSTNIATKA